MGADFFTVSSRHFLFCSCCCSSTAHFHTDFIVQQFQLDRAAFTLLYMSPGEAITQWDDGTLDAVYCWGGCLSNALVRWGLFYFYLFFCLMVDGVAYLLVDASAHPVVSDTAHLYTATYYYTAAGCYYYLLLTVWLPSSSGKRWDHDDPSRVSEQLGQRDV